MNRFLPSRPAALFCGLTLLWGSSPRLCAAVDPASQAQPEKIVWITDLDEALADAKQQNKPLLVDFMADWCEPCIEMEHRTFSNAAVIASTKSFVAVRIDIDKQRKVAAQYGALARAYGGVGIPSMLFLTADGRKLKHVIGFQNAEEFLAAMRLVLKRQR